MPVSVEISRPTCQIDLKCSDVSSVHLDPKRLDSIEVQDWALAMEKKGVLQRVKPSEVKWLTRHMAVPKKGTEEKRVVGCFGPLNAVSQQVSAKSQDPWRIAQQAAKFAFKTKIDLTKGFYVIDVDKQSRPYLGLKCGKLYFMYKRMPMGISSGPAVFSKYGDFIKSKLPPAIAANLFVYQDDFILCHNDPEKLKKATKMLISTLKKDGATINLAKSILHPVRSLPILGYDVSTEVRVPTIKIQEAKAFFERLRLQGQVSKKERAQILGKIQFLGQRNPALAPIVAPLYAIMNTIRDWTESLPLTQLEVNKYSETFSFLQNPSKSSSTSVQEPETTVFSDASNKAYCIKVGSKKHVFAHKIGTESSCYKEVAAVARAFKEIRAMPKNIVWYLDNSAAVQVLLKQKSRSPRVQKLLDFLSPHLQKRKILFQFIAGKDNPADSGTRADLSEAQAKAKATYAEVARKGRSEAMRVSNARRFSFLANNNIS